MKFEFYAGIDPGVSGGIAVLAYTGKVHLVRKMPCEFGAIVECLRPFGGKRTIGAIERVNSSPSWGHVGAFTFGRSYGAGLMALTAFCSATWLVEPKVWQRAMGVEYPKDSKTTTKKNISKARAQEFFPGIEVTHAIADALLIAAYCRRCHEG